MSIKQAGTTVFFMQNKSYAMLFGFILFLVLFTVNIVEAETCTTALPSPFAVKDEDGNFLVPDTGSNYTYTVPEGTRLTFEIEAEILTTDYSNLASEWYNSDSLNGGNPVAVISWWWWGSNGKNPAVDPALPVPEQLNTPDAPANTRRKGIFAIEQTFNEATPLNLPVSIAAVFYGQYVGDQNVPPACPASVVNFLINVTGTPDITPPELITEPANNLIEVGIGNPISVHLNAIDYNNDLQATDDLLAIEWYVEPFGLPVRSHAVNTLNIFQGSSNDDRLQYRFGSTGTFDLTAVAYDKSLNVSVFRWNVVVREPLITRALPTSAEISVAPGISETFEIIADITLGAIDGVCWQIDQGAPFYMPISDAVTRGNFTVLKWETFFNFGTITNFFETSKVSATAYIEDEFGSRILTGDAVNWTVRGERHVNNSKDFTFCGLDWKVKESNPLTQAIGPGNNYFHGDNISMDSDGLHLKLAQIGNLWTSAEVFTADSMPRGIYRFYLEGGSGTRLDQLDTQVMFSPFFYSDDLREIDIEFSNWEVTDTNGPGRLQYIVQPVSNRSLNRFDLSLEDLDEASGKITCQIDWQDDRVIFTSWKGHSAKPPDQASLISDEWVYWSNDRSSDNFIPESGDELKLHLNLYLKNNQISGVDNRPDDDLPVHIIVRAIDHPASWEQWRIKNFGERNVFASSEISNLKDDPDLDNCPNLLEYALGGNPWAFDRGQHLVVDSYKDPNDQKEYLDFTFTRRKSTTYKLSDSFNGISYTPFINYSLESKTSLTDTDWVTEPVILVEEPTNLSDDTERVNYRTESSINADAQKFFRLQVEARD